MCGFAGHDAIDHVRAHGVDTVRVPYLVNEFFSGDVVADQTMVGKPRHANTRNDFKGNKRRLVHVSA